MVNRIKRIVSFFSDIRENRMKLFLIMSVAAVTVVAGLIVSVKTVNIKDGDSVKSISTYSNDTGMILAEAGISLGDHDELTTDENGDITVVRKYPVSIVIGDSKDTVWLSGGTVMDALALDGVEVSDNDILNYSVDELTVSGMTIELINIDYVFSNETVSLPYSSQKVYSTYLTKGSTKVCKGTTGQKVVTYRQKLVNGVATEKVVVKEEVVKSAVNEVVYIGTKTSGSTTTTTEGTAADTSKWASSLRPSNPIMLDSNGAPVTYKKLITGIGTSYSSEDGRACASGLVPYLVNGCVAVNPNVIPYGTKMYITSADGKIIYGYAIAVDTGGFIYSHPERVVDLFYESRSDAAKFGLRNVKIYILE